jgi:YfiH family protein
VRRAPVRRGSTRTELAFFADAVVSDAPGMHFLLTFADCVPLLFLDRKRSAIGAAHAGWRGTALGIAGRVVRVMNDCFGTRPQDLLVGIGPSIGPCCYRVGDDVVDTFRAALIPFALLQENGTSLDLWRTNEMQLEAAGVAAGAIENHRICTSCHVRDFYSHRAERGRTGRFAACIGI